MTPDAGTPDAQGAPGVPDVGVELEQLRGSYRRSLWRDAWLVVWQPFLVAGVARDSSRGWALAYAAVVTVLLLVRLALDRRRPPGTVITDSGLVVRRTSLSRDRVVPWSEVVEVFPASRWLFTTQARLAHSAEVQLPGVPRSVAQRLAAAVPVS